MLLAMDTDQTANWNNPGDNDRDLKMLLHQLCQLQAKYELSEACCPLPQPLPQGHPSDWDRTKLLPEDIRPTK